MRRGKPLKRTPMKRKPRRGGAMPPEVYQAVMVRDGGACSIRVSGVCTLNAAEWAHRQRRQRGNDVPSNGLAACRECHAWCHAHPVEAKAKGWMVHSHHPCPAEVPVLIRRKWWLLDDQGGMEEVKESNHG